jgi:hypothetical protein
VIYRYEGRLVRIVYRPRSTQVPRFVLVEDIDTSMKYLVECYKLARAWE